MVILILEIIFLLAIPMYKTAMLRTAFSEVIGIQKVGRIEVQEYYAITGQWLSSKDEVQNESDLHGYTQSIENGVVTYILPKELSTRLSGNRISFYPEVRDEDTMILQWHCGYSDATKGSDTASYDRTNIPQQNLLNICKPSNEK